jgi:hypothetical protein
LNKPFEISCEENELSKSISLLIVKDGVEETLEKLAAILLSMSVMVDKEIIQYKSGMGSVTVSKIQPSTLN